MAPTARNANQPTVLGMDPAVVASIAANGSHSSTVPAMARPLVNPCLFSTSVLPRKR
jgi:hypothetical protein